MNLFGYKVDVFFLVNEGEVIAYAWNFRGEKALEHIYRIKDFHSLPGEITYSIALEHWLEKETEAVVLKGKRFKLPEVDYKNRKIYEVLTELTKGETITYSELAKRSGFKYQEVLSTLLKNPLQVLIPCHRLLTRKGTLMGFYPLGVEVKKSLLELEGVKTSFVN